MHYKWLVIALTIWSLNSDESKSRDG